MAWIEKYANFDLTTGLDDGSSEANAWQSFASLAAGFAAGNGLGWRLNIKRTAVPYYTASGGVKTDSFANVGTKDKPSMVEGYAVTPQDGGYFEMESDWNIHTLNAGGNYSIVKNIKYTAVGSNVGVINCGSNVSDNALAINVIAKCRGGHPDFQNTINCYIEQSSPSSYITIGGVNQASSVCHNTIFRRVGTPTSTRLVDVDSYAKSQTFNNCVFIGGGAGSGNESLLNFRRMYWSRFTSVNNCVFYNGYNGIAFDDYNSANNNYLHFFANNLFCEMANYGGEFLAPSTAVACTNFTRNAYYNCTAGLTNLAEEFNHGDNIALSADPFEDISNIDYRINNVAGGGAILRATSEYQIPDDLTSTQIYPFGWLVDPTESGGGGGAGGGGGGGGGSGGGHHGGGGQHIYFG